MSPLCYNRVSCSFVTVAIPGCQRNFVAFKPPGLGYGASFLFSATWQYKGFGTWHSRLAHVLMFTLALDILVDPLGHLLPLAATGRQPYPKELSLLPHQLCHYRMRIYWRGVAAESILAGRAGNAHADVDLRIHCAGKAHDNWRALVWVS